MCVFSSWLNSCSPHVSHIEMQYVVAGIIVLKYISSRICLFKYHRLISFFILALYAFVTLLIWGAQHSFWSNFIPKHSASSTYSILFCPILNSFSYPINLYLFSIRALVFPECSASLCCIHQVLISLLAF